MSWTITTIHLSRWFRTNFSICQ